jgi:aspartate/methionine/tyrosine aminotransferase
MSTADMQLVRDSVPGGFNLAVGEPFFLQKVYGKLYPRMVYGNQTYPLINGEPDLLNLLKGRFSGQHVVVTNGAKQAILACAHALRIKHGKSFMTHEAPYWPTYPTMADMSKLGFEEGYYEGVKALRVITSPNNPDGSLCDKPLMEYDIWDAAYASPIYGWNNIVPWHKMSVWSAAKLFGPSGYRIGWLATGDPILAQLASEYVEKTTSGVSLPSQRLFQGLLFNLSTLSHEERQGYEAEARAMLMETSKIFMRLSPFFLEVKGFPAIGQGMFAWVRARDPEDFMKLMAKASVKIVNGMYCGGNSDWFRISLGVLPETMQGAIEAIEEADRG